MGDFIADVSLWLDRRSSQLWNLLGLIPVIISTIGPLWGVAQAEVYRELIEE